MSEVVLDSPFRDLTTIALDPSSIGCCRRRTLCLMAVLTHDEIARRLEALSGWHHRGNAIEKHFDRTDFAGSMRFVNAVADAANAQDHHPDITISWNDVGIALSSHDAGGLTDRDFKLAETIEELAAT